MISSAGCFDGSQIGDTEAASFGLPSRSGPEIDYDRAVAVDLPKGLGTIIQDRDDENQNVRPVLGELREILDEVLGPVRYLIPSGPG